MRISGADDSGWMPIDLTEVAQAITVLQRLASGDGDPVAAGRDPRRPGSTGAPTPESLAEA